MRALQYVPRSKAGRTVVAVGFIIAAVLISGIVLLHCYWPFTESAVRAELSSAASADVQFGKFRNHYFPPGCVAENVVFTRKAGTPLLRIETLEITSNLSGLFRHHVSTVRADHALVNWKEWRDPGQDSSSQRTVVDHLIATNTVVEVAHGQAKQPQRFIFHRLHIDNLRGRGESNFEADVDNPLPHGNLHLSGHFGPAATQGLKYTPVSGSYRLDHADLSVFKSIGGILSSTGNFQGTLDRIMVEGETSTPEFEVAETHHSQPLDTHFSAVVNALNGDVALPHVTARFGRDELDVRGNIARGSDGKRTAVLEINCPRGRIEDTFYPFMHKSQSAITGDVNFSMHVEIPSGHEPFLEKLALQGDFHIQNARFIKPETQVRLSKVAEAPDDRQPNTAMPVQIHGAVEVKDGIARFAHLSLQDHHASAFFWGKYQLTDEHVDMHGKLKTEASLTKTTNGIGSFFAKILEPFFKKKPHENVVPVKISGTYNNPKFGLDL